MIDLGPVDHAAAARVGSKHLLREICAEHNIPFGPRQPGDRTIAVTVSGATNPASIIGDRDITLRRGQQIILSESPAPDISTAQRDFMHQACIELAQAISCNAIVDIHLSLKDNQWRIDCVDSHIGDDAECLNMGSAHNCFLRCHRDDGGTDTDPITAIHGDEHWTILCAIGDTPQAGDELGRLRVGAESRAALLKAVASSLDEFYVRGVPSEAPRLRTLIAEDLQQPGWHPAQAVLPPAAGPWFDIIKPGLETTVQDWPGRTHMWQVGVPPSGPIDDRSLRLANRAVGNPEGAAGLEMTLSGPHIRFCQDAHIALAGAKMAVELNGKTVQYYQKISVKAGDSLQIGPVTGKGLRAYLAIRRGIDVPDFHNSKATFTLGGFGGHAGRALVAGDRLAIGGATPVSDGQRIPAQERPHIVKEWKIGVLAGPHTAPEFLTDSGFEAFLAASWTISSQSNRTGIRLQGPDPMWARTDGGEAGLHPSNIHDNGYAIGAIDLTGNTPVILGPDGPSCGGFVCPLVIPSGERWKMGQLRPGDQVRFVRVDAAGAAELRNDFSRQPSAGTAEPAIRFQQAANDAEPAIIIRRAGDRYLLLEYGPLELDLFIRMRVQQLHDAIAAAKHQAIVDLVPGVRSLLVHYDPDRHTEQGMIDVLLAAHRALPAAGASVPSRTVWLPLAWDDPSTRKAIDIYMRTVNPDAPWCPWNIEFIRRINGLASVNEVKRIVYDAEYLVVGLGDVYLGAPVATPLDPRHRLVTTKYNPARTWTPENAVGIGGAYMCIYGMEGPGGYQFVGRTIQVWNSWRSTAAFQPETPWLLRQFDRIRFFEVSPEELLTYREQFPKGEYNIRIENGEFNPQTYQQFLNDEASSIDAFQVQQRQAFADERQRWQEQGQ